MIPRHRLTYIGVLTATHGLRGEMSAVVDSAAADMLEDMSHVFVSLDGLMVPFAISGVRRRGAQGVLISLKGVTSEAEAVRLRGAELFTDMDLVEDDDADADGFYLEDLIGYDLYDGETPIGKIDDYDDTTENTLFVVAAPDGQALVPATDDLIVEVDTDLRRIIMSLPEGLLNL